MQSIGRAASARSQKADDLERAAFDLRRAADWAAGSWKGRSGEAFVASTADVAAELRGSPPVSSIRRRRCRLTVARSRRSKLR
nr:hypothetical protein GCM10025699_56660 [Microbacterium flavescens]